MAEGNELLDNFDEANTKIRTLSRERGQLQAKIWALNPQLTRANDEIDNLNAQIDALMVEGEEVTRERNRLRADIQPIIDEMGEKDTQLTDAHQEIELLRSHVYQQALARIPTPARIPPPDAFMCPISYEIMKNPVVAEDEHTYERGAIEEWFKNHNTSPMTRAVIGTHLIPNRSLRQAIEEMQPHFDTSNNARNNTNVAAAAAPPSNNSQDL